VLYVSGGTILEMKGRVKTLNDGKETMLKVLNSGEALEKFRLMLISQGVTEVTATTLCQGDMWSVLPSVSPNQVFIIKAYSSGTCQIHDMVFPFNALFNCVVEQ
jgi:thymidine phosphorylase